MARVCQPPTGNTLAELFKSVLSGPAALDQFELVHVFTTGLALGDEGKLGLESNVVGTYRGLRGGSSTIQWRVMRKYARNHFFALNQCNSLL